MKSMKGGILRKIKSIPSLTSLKHNLVFQVNRPIQYFQSHLTANEEHDNDIPPEMFCQNISSDLTKDVRKGKLHSKDMMSPTDNNKMENTSTWEPHSCKTVPLSEHEVQLLTQTQTSTPQALQEYSDTMEKSNSKDDENRVLELSPLSNFEEKCPPGGSDKVIFYTTSLRGIRKTFEDCNIIRFLLESFRVVYYERDVSMHVEYREELWRILSGRVVPPRLFIRGRDIGGADEVVGLHEQGILKKLLHGIPLLPSTSPCKGCCGIRFVLCFNCHGSCKITDPEGKANEFPSRCPECNENGLIKCPICS
ncbi:uncharacterized protein At5g39865-like [Nicotiana tomentosiformis]|uniref:uncharacterized protein At5g39865-like n=1 Tax=Nicotiana tomentosiformis TaxID=4098 RepID=UPI00051CAC5A|nr:uncharacterized protein At5g39865-like [Nicotiana tomentosiformis]